jgi:hypothetical protein
MTRRATFTKADLARAVRVADQLGKVALWTAAGIAFVESSTVALPLPDQEPPTEGNSCDKAFGP